MTGFVDPTPAVFRNMRMARKMRKWSAAELAQRLTTAGYTMTRSRIANMEAGRVQDASVALLYALAHVFEVAPDTLTGASACATCQGAPPAGFQCKACGADGGSCGTAPERIAS